MNEYIFLMHNDTHPSAPAAVLNNWTPYIGSLQASGRFRGGSAIGPGFSARKDGATLPLTTHIGGFIRVEAYSLDDALSLLIGNPVYESGGTVEIRELPRTD